MAQAILAQALCFVLRVIVAVGWYFGNVTDQIVGTLLQQGFLEPGPSRRNLSASYT